MDKRFTFDPVGWTLVSDLSERYKIVKSVVYTRIKALGIRPRRISIHSYVSDEQLTLLDALHEFIQGGGTTAEFLFHRGIEPDDDESSEN